MRTKALVSFTILYQSATKKDPEERGPIKLYREGGALIWRIGGPLGDECETLPRRPATVAQAKCDARQVFPTGWPWWRVDGWA